MVRLLPKQKCIHVCSNLIVQVSNLSCLYHLCHSYLMLPTCPAPTHDFHFSCFLLSYFTSHIPFFFHSLKPTSLLQPSLSLLLLQLSPKCTSHAYLFWHRSSCYSISLWSGSCNIAGIYIYGVGTIDLGNISSSLLEECVSRQFLSSCYSKIHYIYCFPLIHYANYIGRQGH